jgi:hypothetical protein
MPRWAHGCCSRPAIGNRSGAPGASSCPREPIPTSNTRGHWPGGCTVARKRFDWQADCGTTALHQFAYGGDTSSSRGSINPLLAVYAILAGEKVKFETLAGFWHPTKVHRAAGSSFNAGNSSRVTFITLRTTAVSASSYYSYPTPIWKRADPNQ